MWLDGTIAHGLHFIPKAAVFGADCGGLGRRSYLVNLHNEAHQYNLLGYSVKLWNCRFTKQSVNYQLCKYNDKNESAERIRAVSIQSLTSHQPLSNSSLITCPLQHLTHSFLACDILSACSAHRTVSYGTDKDDWDLPSYSTCPAVMSPLPPSYACASGSGRLPYTFVCDHHQDCRDSSDEEFCVYPDCQGDKALQCGSIRQVRVMAYCYCHC